MEFEIINSVSPFTELAIPKTRYPSGVDVTLTPVDLLFDFFQVLVHLENREIQNT